MTVYISANVQSVMVIILKKDVERMSNNIVIPFLISVYVITHRGYLFWYGRKPFTPIGLYCKLQGAWNA
jgi:hypothetical protein